VGSHLNKSLFMEHYLSTLAQDPQWASKVERLQEMDFEQLKAFRQEEHTGVEHNVAEHFFVEKLILEYWHRVTEDGHTPYLTAFANHNYWTDDLWEYVNEPNALYGPSKEGRLIAYAKDFFTQ